MSFRSSGISYLGKLGDDTVSEQLVLLEGRASSLGLVCDNPVMEELGFDTCLDQGFLPDNKPFGLES